MNQLEQTPKQYRASIEALKREANGLFYICILFLLIIAFLVSYTFVLKETEQKLYGKIKQDSISIHSYKDLLTPINQ